ncbi:nuclear transport factor 2 family protein [Nocardia transvalensis]|uniref:nuclear transport factor 2 family protein n=1 Tax=Nocardia transvalensis TaxID=37333 RepID=UPI0018936FB0|nr:nuclear transport factor 2 family protein [Nocardia transvalensis]MBF6332265.1 nuclear transport factor 2 family protein [Nocardia transvalensis]
MSETRIEDRQAIGELMTGWIHRDKEHWAELAALFHADATLRILWFSGPAHDFIDGSRRMGHGPLRSKHFIGAPTVRFTGDRAFVETNAILLAELTGAGIGATIHNRFLDRVSRRDGAWRIEHRDSVYDMGGFTYPFGVGGAPDIDAEALSARHPREYAALAYLLETAGHPVTGTYPTRFGDQEAAILEAGDAWLAAADARR